MSNSKIRDTMTENDVSRKNARKKLTKQRYKRKNYPKKALTAYNIFFKEIREKILTEHGKTNFQEMVKTIAALWKEITPEDKLRFDVIASRDLTRFKEEVRVYEENVIENNREKKKQKVIDTQMKSPGFDPSYFGINANTHRENDCREAALISPVHNVQNQHVSRDNAVAVAEMGNAYHTLTSDELELAMRIQLRNVSHEGKSQSTAANCANIRVGRDPAESKWTPTDMQLYRRNLLGMGSMVGDHTLPSNEGIIGNLIALDLHRLKGNMEIKNESEKIERMAQASLNDRRNRLCLDDTLATGIETGGGNLLAVLGEKHAAVSHGIESREKFDHRVDSMAALNQIILEKRRNNRGKDPMIGSQDEEVMSLVEQAKNRFLSRSGTHTDGVKLPYLFDEKEIQNNFTLHNHMVRSNKTQIRNYLMLNNLNGGFQKLSSEDERIKCMMAGRDLRVTSQMRLAMLEDQKLKLEQLGNLSRDMGMGNYFEEMRLREENFRQRERCFMKHLGGGAPSSVHQDLSRANLLVHKDARRSHILSGDPIIPGFIASQYHNNAGIQSTLM